MLLSEGIRHIGDGLLEVAEERLQGLLAPEDIADVYDVEQTPFARGKFATVRRAIHKKSGVHYAAKCLRRRRRAQCWAKDISHEIAVLMLCSDSRHIVKLHAVYETKNETALILELATGGELQAMLDDEGCLTEEQTRICMREILTALQYLHKKSIAHLDLKPQNILLCGQNVEDGLKLCDFGISRVVEEGGKVREILGTPDYVAPEVLQYEPLSLQTDIWSIGVLAYVLLTGCSPFGGDTKQETFLNISQCNLTFNDELFDEVSPIAIDFIKSTCRIKPNDRLTVLQCLEHRWLQDDTIARPLAENGFIEITADYNKQSQQHIINGCSKISTTSSLILPTTNNLTTSPQTISLTTAATTITTAATCNNKDVADDVEDDVNEEDKENIIIISNNHSNNSHKQTLHKDIMTTITLPTTPSIIANSVPTPIITTTVSMAISPQIPPVSSAATQIKNIDTSFTAVATAPVTTNSNNHQHHNHHHHHNEITTATFVICCDSHKNNKSITTVALQTSTPSAKQQQQIYQQKQQQQQSSINIPTNPVQAQLMFFPDAPTTPKVSRKAPPDSPPSVKALVKKFQIESTGAAPCDQNNHNTVATSPVSTTAPVTLTATTTITSPIIVCRSLLTNNSQNNNIRHNHEIIIKNKLNEDKLKNIDKEYCVCTCDEDGIKCLSCIKNNTNHQTTQQTQQQQQHNHRHHVVINGRKSNIISSIDQGIIC